MTEGIGGLRLPDGCKCVSSIAANFNYYSPLEVESAQSTFFEEKVIPTNGLGSDPYEFVFEPMGDSFLCMNSIYMYVQLKIVKNGTAIDENEIVAPVNNLLTSLWQTIETKINNVTINPSSSYNIPYKGILETSLSIDAFNNTYIKPSMFHVDAGKDFDTLTDQQEGFRRRRSCIKDGYFDVCGPICNDFIRSENYLAPGNKLALKFSRVSDEFVLLTETNNNYKLVITDIYMIARRLTLHQNILSSIWSPSKVQSYKSIYTEVKDFSLPPNITSRNIRLSAGGRLPKSVVVAQVLTEAFVGSYKKNPFNMQHFKIGSINLKINGRRFPQDPFSPDFEKGLISREWNNVYMNTGKWKINSGNCIQRNHFQNGITVFPFDLTPDQCNLYHTHAGQEGSIELEISWREALPAGITILVYSVFDQIVLMRGVNSQPVVSIF